MANWHKQAESHFDDGIAPSVTYLNVPAMSFAMCPLVAPATSGAGAGGETSAQPDQRVFQRDPRCSLGRADSEAIQEECSDTARNRRTRKC